MTKVVIPLLETNSGLTCGKDFGVCNNPEFLREGSALDDFVHPPKTVIGESDARSGDLLASLYSEIDAPLVRQSLNVVEMTKYVDNAWHALKVGFGNEVGRMCKALNIDSHEVMDIFCQDVKLNISTAYLTPGPPFGGSCLPKDLRALTHKAQSLNVEVPILSAVLPSNEVHIMACVRAVMEAGHKKVGVLGLSFKPETDDLRESPIVELVERLLGKGYDIRIFDRNVSMARVVGANRDYILNRIPHVSQLLVDQIDEVIEHGDTILIGTFSEEHNAAVIPVLGDKSIVDLVRGIVSQTEDGYSGLCW
jgi:GDP-mannose 6-dehydrogenase